jgi:hypothetical protein
VKEMRRMSVTGQDDGSGTKEREEEEGVDTGRKQKPGKESFRGVLKSGWEKVKEFLTGRKVIQDSQTGEIEIRKEGGREDEEYVLSIEDWIDEKEDGKVEFEIVKKDDEKSTDSVSILSSVAETDTYSFLDCMTERTKDSELEKKKLDGKKRKREPDSIPVINTKGLIGTQGWEEREKAKKEERKWVRTVVEEDSQTEWEEKIPLPEDYRLGLDRRGMVLNSSARQRNNFGVNKEALCPKAGKERGEKDNWTATFTRGGCIACRDEKDQLNHAGRTSAPVILLIGDEARPPVVGFTRKGEEESNCTWVYRKEHLSLQEVPQILSKLNKEKQEYDRQQYRRPHEFFIPNGSKILVSSYVHLRREGLEGYISDFNAMVKEVWGVTGDIGIEILPVTPVVFEGIDTVGSCLISGLKDWIRWVGVQKGRDSIKELAETGGREYDESIQTVYIYKPWFNSMYAKGGGIKEWRNRGNSINFVRGDRKEVRVYGAAPSREIDRVIYGGRKEGEERTEEDKRRFSFADGVSIDAEYTFTSGIEKYCAEAVKEGNFTGSYTLNKKDQLKYREQKELKGQGKVSVLAIGGSQMGRIGAVLGKVGGEAVSVEKHIRMRGYLSREEGARIQKELEEGKGMSIDKILIGGPGNSLVKHGEGKERGYGAERKVVIEQGEGAEVLSASTSYHLTEPTKMTLCERNQVASVVGGIVKECKEWWPEAEVIYVGTLPRFVEKCCGRRDHMAAEDPQVINSSRKELDKDIMSKMVGEKLSITVLDWFEPFGWSCEPSLKDIVEKKIISADNVHLSAVANRSAAVFLCRRMLLRDFEENPVQKRRRLY